MRTAEPEASGPDLSRVPAGPAGRLLPAGAFTAVLDQDAWVWSRRLVQLLGHQEHPVEATTEMFLEHVWASDRPAVWRVLEEAPGSPAATMATLLTRSGRPLSVLVSAQPSPDDEHLPDWLMGTIHGTVVDLGDRFRG